MEHFMKKVQLQKRKKQKWTQQAKQLSVSVLYILATRKNINE